MSSPLTPCLEKLASLQVPENRKNWGTATKFRCPSKPLLLLAVIDMAAIGAMQDNLAEPSYELARIYNRYWETISRSNTDLNLAKTFIGLEKEGLWEMTGLKETADDLPIYTMGKLHKSYMGARISPEIFTLLTDKESRKKMRETLISTYFAKELHSELLDVALVNHAAAIYSKEILNEAVIPSIKTGRGEEINRRISTIGFDSAISTIYEHRCAICGIKMMTPEGHSAVGATRIIPRHMGGDDHPSNGLALCKICEWSFKNGMIGIDEKNEVIIPIAVRLNGNLPGHILIFKGRTITKPKQEMFRPSRKNLSWHRLNILRD